MKKIKKLRKYGDPNIIIIMQQLLLSLIICWELRIRYYLGALFLVQELIILLI